MFTVREAAWHRLVEPLGDYPTREQAQKIAHPWEPEREPLYRKRMVPRSFGPAKEIYEPITDHQLVVRSDDREELGVISDTLGLVTNTEMYDVAEAIEGIDKGLVKYETGGSLYGGKKVWLLLRLAEPIIVAGDPHGACIPYYALQNNNDGQGAFRGQATMTRIVCDNTSHMADIDAQSRGTEFVFRHTSNVTERLEEAKQALAGWRMGLTQWQNQMAHLSELGITDERRELFLEQFIPMPPPHSASDRVIANVEDARKAIRDILAGPTCEGINDSAYGLVQASVEYNQHVRRAASKESRFKRAYLDRSQITTDAVKIALEVAQG